MRIAVIGVNARGLLAFRGDLLRTMVDAGHAVLAITPDHDPMVQRELRAMGVTHEVMPIERNGLNPVGDLRATIVLRRLLSGFHPDVTLSYAAKPVVYGSLAARLAGVSTRSAMITGVGSVLTAQGGLGQRMMAFALRCMYAVALRQNAVVFFQNRDDLSLFVGQGLVGKGQRRVLIDGSGVNLEDFRPAPLPELPLVFLFVGRLIRDKGIREFVEAARLVHGSHPDVEFRAVGSSDTNPTAIPPHEIASWEAEGLVRFDGEVLDVRPAIAAAHVLVLPSYGEGMPRSVLEAMAMGRPVITTDVPGCRDAVQDGRTGYVVPVRDPAALAAAMRSFIEDPRLLVPMGREGRVVAEERFDVHSVNRKVMSNLGIPGRAPLASGAHA